MILRTWTGRELRVTTEVDWSRGRVFYMVDKIGTFTIERDPYGLTDERAGSVWIYYGRYTDDRWFSHDPYPEAPVLFGVTLSGACGLGDPVKRATEPMTATSHFGWNARRAEGGQAPERTRKRAHEICCALLVHYLTCDEYPAIEQVRARYLAPQRLRKHTERISELNTEIAKLQAELAVELRGADVQAALTAPAGALAAETVDAT